MKIVKPSAEVMFFVPENGMSAEQAIEMAGRNCYKSEDRITPDSAEKFVRMIRKRGHHAMLEFGYVMAHIVGDRGNSHEQVRHRLASYAQESTRYCNYSKFGNEITVVEQAIAPIGSDKFPIWKESMERAERDYFNLLKNGWPPEEARSVLPIALKAEIVVGANLREWRHIFNMRCSKFAHPIIRGIMLGILKKFNEKMPSVYEDLAEEFLIE